MKGKGIETDVVQYLLKKLGDVAEVSIPRQDNALWKARLRCNATGILRRYVVRLLQVQLASLVTDKFTEREVDVLRLLARGLTNADIAARLYLSEGTVRNQSAPFWPNCKSQIGFEPR